MALLLVSFGWSYPLSAAEVASLPYYGEKFREWFEQDDVEWKPILFRILSQAHKRRANKPDLIVDHCGDSNQNCYQHTALSYKEARRVLFGDLHLERQNGQYFITTVYCQKKLGAKDFPKGQGPGPDRIPAHNILNTEHTWPQSRFSKRHRTDVQKSDLHALFPTMAMANAIRSNLPYAFVDQVDVSPCPGTVRGHNSEDPGQPYFEPPDSHKGNAARALFYFSVRYELKIDPVEEQNLRQWHKMDPIDDNEWQRHEEIFSIQYVRNPFIDFPELVEKIKNF